MNDADAVALLERMVRIPSPSGAEAELAEFLVGVLAERGFDAHVDAVGNAIATLGDGDPDGAHGVLLGHIDTVAGTPPVQIVDGKLYGRGSVDAKGSFACFIAAAARAHEAGRLVGRLTLVGCVEEEAPSSRGARHVAPQLAPDWCIVGEPSGWDHVTLGYKGHLAARLEHARPATHSAHDAESAAAYACRTWTAIASAADAFNAPRERLYDQLLPHLAGVRSEGDGLSERVVLDVTLRLPEDLPPAGARDWLGACAAGFDVATSEGLPAWSGPRTSTLARRLARAVARTGGRVSFQRKTGTADLNIVAPVWGCPAVAYGPGDAALDHRPDEHLELAEFARAIAVLTECLGSAPADPLG